MALTLRRCPTCRSWYPKAEGDCPECGEEKGAINSWLVTARMNSALYAQAERALKDR